MTHKPPHIIHRSNVNAWQCDENGHLNVRYYIGKNHQGLPHLLAETGLTPRILRDSNVRPRLVDQHARFHREARLAMPLTVYGAIAASDGARVTAYCELRHSTNDMLYSTFNSQIDLVDRESGEVRCLDVDVRQSGFEVPEHGNIRSLHLEDAPAASVTEALELGYFESGRGTVMAEECDRDGRMEIYQYAGRVADAIPYFLSVMQSEKEFGLRAAGKLGGAVIENRVEYCRELQAGDRFVILSGSHSFATKTQRLSHLIFDLESGRLAAHIQGIAVALDLETRKAVPFSEERRARMRAHQISDTR